METDRRGGRRAPAVPLGPARTRALSACMLASAFLCAPLPWALGSMTAWLLLPLLALPLAAGVLRTVRTRTDGPALDAALARTGPPPLVFCLLFAAGINANGRVDPAS